MRWQSREVSRKRPHLLLLLHQLLLLLPRQHAEATETLDAMVDVAETGEETAVSAVTAWPGSLEANTKRKSLTSAV
jgi:hypothetical protein